MRQSDTAGGTLPLPLVVRALDANGNRVGRATVSWVADAGTVSAAATVTDSEGSTQVTWTLPTSVRTANATATLQETGVAVVFGATVTHATPARLAFTVEPTDVQQGAVIAPAVAVSAYDRFDNPASGFAGQVTLTLLANPEGLNKNPLIPCSIASGTPPSLDPITGTPWRSDSRTTKG